jgi:hypothetical protein
MPKAIFAIRSYPLTLLLAALVFALTLVLTTTSIGKVGGGDDEGSGFGGTGRAGESGGSGFGGTGSPFPFFGLEEDEGEKARQELDRMREELRPVDVPEALQRAIESNLMRESARIAEAAKTPTGEQTAAAPVQDSVDTERLLQSDAAPAMQIARPTRQLSAPVIMPEPGNIIESFQLPPSEPGAQPLSNPLAQPQTELAELNSPTLPEAEADAINNLQLSPELSRELDARSEAELVKEELQLAESDLIEQESQRDSADSDERRVAPERIPRPELPPFQRIRPAVDRISISAPRPQPMRI